MSLIRTLLAGLIFSMALVAPPVNAVGYQQPAEDMLTRILPDDCIFFAQWVGIDNLDPQRNPTEKWLAQDEIKLTFKKLFEAIEGYQELHPIENPILNELLSKVPAIVQDCSASMYVEAIDPQLGFEKSGSMGAVIKLNEHEAWANGILKKIMDTEQGKQIEKIDYKGTTAFRMSMSDQPDDDPVHFAVVKGHLVMTFGINAFESAMANLKTPEPKWLVQMQEQINTGRTLGSFHFDPTTLFEMNRMADERDRIPAFLGLDKLKSVSVWMGLDSDGFATSTMIRCPGELTGVWSVLGTDPIDESYIDELPGDATSTGAIRLAPLKIFEMIKMGMQVSEDTDTVQEFVDNVESISGLNFEKEILESFEGFVSSYQSLSPLTGGTVGVVSLRIKDPEVFSGRLAKFNRNIAVEAEAMGMGQLVEKQSNGQTIHLLERPVYLGPSLSWCHVEDQLYFATDSKSISTHLRKRGRKRGRLIDDVWFKKMFDYGQSRQWGDPIAFSHVDVVTMMELMVPLAQTFLSGQEIPDFDFTVDDIPPVDVLTNGVNENVTVVFRTPDGFRIIERSTLPGLSSVAVSGVMVGMLLPAVQQVRQAARRATTMNNLRQLELALHNYDAVHGHLPPAYSTDKNGKPLLSWRVLILPYLEEQDLYDRFHLDEPWDSEHNLKLVKEMPEFYENPGVAASKGETTFLGVTGEHGVFGLPKGIKFAQITDGSSQTISIVDANRDNTVVWTSPQDFDPAEQQDIVGTLSGTWPAGFMVGLCDGSAHVFGKDDFAEDELRSLMDRRDGAVIDIFDR